MIGEPDAGNPHVRFDEGRQETCVRAARLSPTLQSPQMKKRYLPYEYGERRWFFGAMFRWPHFRCPRMAGSGCPPRP